MTLWGVFVFKIIYFKLIFCFAFKLFALYRGINVVIVSGK